jgi:hypothetical protein
VYPARAPSGAACRGPGPPAYITEDALVKGVSTTDLQDHEHERDRADEAEHADDRLEQQPRTQV